MKRLRGKNESMDSVQQWRRKCIASDVAACAVMAEHHPERDLLTRMRAALERKRLAGMR